MKITKNKGNIIYVGIILLLVLSVAMLIVGRVINNISQKINNSVVEEKSQLHFNVLRAEFINTERILNLIAAEVSEKPKSEVESIGDEISEMVFLLDPKISRVWLSDKSRQTVTIFQKGGIREQHFSEQTLYSEITLNINNQIKSGSLYGKKGEEFLSFSRVIDIEGEDYLIGIDIILAELFEYMSNLDIKTTSYGAVFNGEGTILLHPDSTLIGRRAVSDSEIDIISKVWSAGETARVPVMSEYLGMQVTRIYYPLEVNGSRLIVAISTLNLSADEEIAESKLYTSLIIVVAILFFAIFMTFSQWRWRQEYKRRMLAEEQSAHLQIKQIIDQVSPHFLFNSLNSIYSLIDKEPRKAREFVLQLSGIYRYALERRKEVLSSLGNELDFINKYLFLQKTRFGDQMQVNINIPDSCENRLIPFMSLQTLIENAVKHNSFSPQKPLYINIYVADGSVIVENTYAPKKKEREASTRLGLERLRSIYAYYAADNFFAGVHEKTFRVVLPLLDNDSEKHLP